MNKAVDMSEKKLAEFNEKFWKDLIKIKKSEASKKKSVVMGNQARHRGLRNTTKERIGQATTVKLTMELGRKPYQTELDEVVDKETAAVISKNEEKKRKQGKEGTTSNRLLLAET